MSVCVRSPQHTSVQNNSLTGVQTTHNKSHSSTHLKQGSVKRKQGPHAWCVVASGQYSGSLRFRQSVRLAEKGTAHPRTVRGPLVAALVTTPIKALETSGKAFRLPTPKPGHLAFPIWRHKALWCPRQTCSPSQTFLGSQIHRWAVHGVASQTEAAKTDSPNADPSWRRSFPSPGSALV